jgi:spore maturation protein A
MEKIGITAYLSRLLRPLLHLVFPGAKKDPVLANSLSANICANFLGLGNAATPMGIRAAQTMSKLPHARHELARLVVLNTASVQLLPTTVASVRAACGSDAPLEILPAVWLTSVLSVTAGLLAARLLQRLWRDN